MRSFYIKCDGSAKILFCEPYLNTQSQKNITTQDIIVVELGKKKSLFGEKNTKKRNCFITLPTDNLNQLYDFCESSTKEYDINPLFSKNYFYAKSGGQYYRENSVGVSEYFTRDKAGSGRKEEALNITLVKH